MTAPVRVPGRAPRIPRLLADAAVGVAYCAGALTVLSPLQRPLLTAAGAVLTVVAVAVSRSRPAVGTVAATAVFWLSPVEPGLAWLGALPLAYAGYRVAERCAPGLAVGLLLLGLTGPVASALPGFEHAGGVLPFGLLLVASWIAGGTVRRRRQETEQRLREAARDAELARERAGRQVVDERLLLARELHDVVAHSISAITIQAGYGRLALDREPAATAAALGAIEATGRQTLDELRRLLGVMRTSAPLEPAPAISGLPALVRQAAASGLRAELTVGDGLSGLLPAGLELAAYRIVQEALTNVVRHAGARTARVTVLVDAGALRIRISDDGRCPSGPDRTGNGLVGMRERVALYGGTLSAGPGPHGGFQVTAVLPVPAAVLPA